MLRIVVLLSLIFLCSCGDKKSGKKIVFVGISPYGYAARELAQDAFEVHTLIKAGQNAHTFSPTPKQIQKLSLAHIYFSSGLEFEKSLIPRIKKLNPTIRIVSLYEGLPHRSMDHDGHGEHCSGHHGAATDPHLWLSPELYLKQAKRIATSLISLDTSLEKEIKERVEGMTASKERLDSILTIELAPYKGKSIYVYHPAFGYFTDHYSLQQKAIETGGREPSAKALQRFINEVKEVNAEVIFVQNQYSKKSAEIVGKETGCRVVSINPMPVDYFKDLETLGTTIARELRK